MPPRSLNSYEAALLRRFCPSVADAEAFDQITAADVAPEDRDYHHIKLIYPDRVVPKGGYTVLADCIGYDADGRVIEMLILGDPEGFPHEIEIRRPDLSPLLQLVSADAWVPR